MVADRLAAAVDLRRAGQWQAAEVAYLNVAAQYPRAPEAYVATLAAGALRLEHLEDPVGALRLYESLAHGSALGVEALSGVARCYQALGNRTAELSALRSVIDAYPTSIQADRARVRLKQLSAPSTAP